MKKVFKQLTACFCSILMIITSSVVSADVRNEIKGSANGYNAFAVIGPSINDIIATGDNRVIKVPDANSYFSSYQSMYVDASKGHSVYVYKWPNSQSGKMPVAYHGIKVTLLAEQEGFTCVLYHTDENTLRAGWVSSANLTWYYPGRTEYLGRSTGSNGTYYGNAEASWSRDYFVGTRQKYTNLQKTYYNCNQFTLDYQVTARNGADTQACLGPRTVYVNDGSGWVAVGTFSYNDLGPVNVVITLDQPMTIMAVATSASCSKPDTFSFRQSVLDIYCN